MGCPVPGDIYANLYVDIQLLSIPPSDVRSSKEQHLPSYCTGIRRVCFAIWQSTCVTADRDSSVSTANHNGLDGTGIKFLWGQDFPHPSRPSLGPTQLSFQ
jgi:hypothetical protein